MSYSIFSLVLLLFAVALTAGVLLVPVAFIAGNVLHMWGTSSVLEWLSEAFLRVFSGTLRRRFMRAINRQHSVGVDKSRRAHPYLMVSVSPADVRTLTGPGGDLAGLASDAVRAYARHARAEGWTSDAMPQIAVVPDELVRRGSVKVRPVSGAEFIEVGREMSDWDDGADDDPLGPAPAPPARVCDSAQQFRTTHWSEGDVVTTTMRPSESVTEALGSTDAVTMPVAAAQIVLDDAHGRQHPVTSESVLVGRGPECRVRLESAEVSREHLSIYFQEGMWWLRDRGSRNGTAVDGIRVQGTGPVRLRKGSQIVLGSEKAGEKLMIAELEEH